jgi:hypothetical protein
MVKKGLTILVGLICAYGSMAQTALLDEIKLMDFQRNQQLLGRFEDSALLRNYSFLVRSTSKYHLLDRSVRNNNKFIIDNFQVTDNRQHNDYMPSGFNDGTMYPAVGNQERVSVGVRARWHALDINLQPEWVTLENKAQFVDLGNQSDRNWWTRYYFITANNIEDYRQFGKKPINQLFPGQSRIGLTYEKFALGVSTENQWWGPGRRNSLLFTNNAPGFLHAYLETNKPIKTPIGHFEAKMLFGQLDSTAYTNPDDSIMKTVWAGAIASKNYSPRTIQSFIITYQPKWLDGLYLGYAYSKLTYSEGNSLFAQQSASDKAKMGVGVLMARFVMPKDHTEFYAEVGTPNQLPYPWKFFNDSSRTGFVVGAKKLFPNQKRSSYMEFDLEFTQLQMMDPRKVFTMGAPFDGPQYNSWYTSTQVRQGYTNDAQLLGASIGPGSNSQMMGISWNKGYNRVGLHVERFVHNNDFYNYAYLSNVGNGKATAYWVDLMAGLEGQIHPQKNIILSASFMNTQTMNWRWVRIEDGVHTWSQESSKTPDKFNFQFNFAVKYFFNGAR